MTCVLDNRFADGTTHEDRDKPSTGQEIDK